MTSDQVTDRTAEEEARYKELSAIADEKFIEYWMCQDRKKSKELHREYIELIKDANEAIGFPRSYLRAR